MCLFIFCSLAASSSILAQEYTYWFETGKFNNNQDSYSLWGSARINLMALAGASNDFTGAAVYFRTAGFKDGYPGAPARGYDVDMRTVPSGLSAPYNSGTDWDITGYTDMRNGLFKTSNSPGQIWIAKSLVTDLRVVGTNLEFTFYKANQTSNTVGSQGKDPYTDANNIIIDFNPTDGQAAINGAELVKTEEPGGGITSERDELINDARGNVGAWGSAKVNKPTTYSVPITAGEAWVDFRHKGGGGRMQVFFSSSYRPPNPPPGGSELSVNKNVQRQDANVELTVTAGEDTFDRYIVRTKSSIVPKNDQNQVEGTPFTIPGITARQQVFSGSPSPVQQSIAMGIEPWEDSSENFTYFTVLAQSAEGAWYKMSEVVVTPYGTAVTLSITTDDQRASSATFQRTRQDIGYEMNLVFESALSKRGTLIRADEARLAAGGGENTGQPATSPEAGDLYIDMRVFDNSRSGITELAHGNDITSNYTYVTKLDPLTAHLASPPGSATPYRWPDDDPGIYKKTFLGFARPTIGMAAWGTTHGYREWNFQPWTQPISGGNQMPLATSQQVQVMSQATASGDVAGLGIGSPSMGASVDLGINPISSYDVNLSINNPYPWGEYYLYLVSPTNITTKLATYTLGANPASTAVPMAADIEPYVTESGTYKLILAQYTPVDTGSFNATGITGTAPAGTLNAAGPRLVPGVGTFNYGWSRVVEVTFQGRPPTLEINASITHWN